MLYASLKRRAIASGFIFVDCCRKLPTKRIFLNLGIKKSSIGGKQYLDYL